MIKIKKHINGFNITSLLVSSLALISLTACNEQAATPTIDSTNQIDSQHSNVQKNIAHTIIAQAGNNTISLAEIDKDIELKLFDLEWRKYELRRSTLNHKLAQQTTDKTKLAATEILLTPPKPPRITLPKDKRLVKGHQDAPISLSLFCSYQSSHCARLQPVLNELENRFKDFISIAFYDLPMGYHRYGKSAANAVHCANEFSAPWDFQSALYSDISQLTPKRFKDIASQLGFDNPKFENCLSTKKYYHVIDQDLLLSQRIGLAQVPTLLVSGLYIKGPQTSEAFSYYIQQELKRLNLINPTQSVLPIELLATTVSDTEQNSSAMLAFTHGSSVRTYQVGDILQENITLFSIHPRRILLNNNGQLEYVLLKSQSISKLFSNHEESEASSREQHLTEPSSKHSLASLKGQPYDPEKILENQPELKATGNMRLSKKWLEPHLKNQEKLQEHFQVADHEVEGVHLVKLDNIERNGFFKMLGLQTGDVVLRVNNEWVHDQHNPLWTALSYEEDITLTVMRKGYPIRYDYQIK